MLNELIVIVLLQPALKIPISAPAAEDDSHCTASNKRSASAVEEMPPAKTTEAKFVIQLFQIRCVSREA
jgi:hypothetical protein